MLALFDANKLLSLDRVCLSSDALTGTPNFVASSSYALSISKFKTPKTLSICASG
jgi:hypothetical protein